MLRLEEDGSVEVVATSGDARLGGNDFDAVLIKWARAELGAPDGDAAAYERRLAAAVEEAKKRLSVVTAVNVTLPAGVAQPAAPGEGGNGGDDAPCVELSRVRLEQLCDGLFRRLKTPLYEVALSAKITLPGELDPDHGSGSKQNKKGKVRRKEAKYRPTGRQKYLPTGDRVEEVILVGGATHMVGVRRLIANLFDVDPRRTVDPMQAVALGAAVHAGVLAGEITGLRVLQAWQAKLGRMLDESAGDEDGDVAAEAAAEAAEEEAEEEAAMAAWRAEHDEELGGGERTS